MRLLRIYDRDRLVRELHNVTATNVSNTGALICHMFGAAAPGALALVVFAPGTWTDVEEWTDHAAEQPREAEAEAEYGPEAHTEAGPVPVVPGDEEPPAGTAAPTALLAIGGLLTDGQRVHEAMQVHCVCSLIRCPVVLNGSTSEQRRWWQMRQRGGKTYGRAPEVAPRMQCSHELGHAPIMPPGALNINTDTVIAPHQWREGGWPYGPHNHHPACPRHPDSYNRAVLADIAVQSEGQPHHAAGVTEADQLPAETDPAPSATLVRPYIGAHAEQPGTPLGRAALTAVADPETTGMLYSRESSSGPGLPERGEAQQWPTLPYNANARQSWGVCAVFAPGYAERAWCGLPELHQPGDGHATTLPGGDRVTW